MASNDTIVGWTRENGGRGTWSLIWTCFATMFLAVWVTYHPVIPAPWPKDWLEKHKWLRRFDVILSRRIADAFTILLGPEMLLVNALLDLMVAIVIKRAHRASGIKSSLREAFFVGMGGYRIKPPVFAELKESHYVLEHAHIMWLLKEGILEPAGRTTCENDNKQEDSEKTQVAITQADTSKPIFKAIPKESSDDNTAEKSTSAHTSVLSCHEDPHNRGASDTNSVLTNEPVSASSPALPGQQDTLDQIEYLHARTDQALYPIAASVSAVPIETNKLRNPAQGRLLDVATIKLRSTSDGLVKCVVAAQALYFVIICIGRWANQLPVSLLELIVLSYISVSLLAYILWWLKSQDVKESVVFDLDLTPDQWRLLTLLCDTKGSRPWTYDYALILAVDNEALLGPLSQWLDTSVSEGVAPYVILGTSLWMFCVSWWLSGAIHFIAWSSNFPSTIEQTLWRSAAILHLCIPIIFLIGAIGAGVAIILAKNSCKGEFTDDMENRIATKGTVVIIVVMVVLCFLVRITVLVLALMQFRAAPAAIYDTWEISNWPLFWL